MEDSMKTRMVILALALVSAVPLLAGTEAAKSAADANACAKVTAAAHDDECCTESCCHVSAQQAGQSKGLCDLRRASAAKAQQQAGKPRPQQRANGC
jgi:hypothetical protein